MAKRLVGTNGQAIPVMMVILAVAMVGIALVARLGVAADESARARTAADAAALAGAAHGQAAAQTMAEANGGELLDFVRFGDEVEVVVQVESARARARAEVTVVWSPLTPERDP